MQKLRVLPWIAVVLYLCVGPVNGCGPSDPFREKPALTADAVSLPGSVVSAHLEAPVDGKNIIWCATFQIVWNETCKLTGGQLHFAPPENPVVAILNRQSVTSADLDPASYIAVAGYVRDGIYDRITQQLQEKFHGKAAPHYLPKREDASRPQDIVAYCYLFKQLDFLTPFERIQTPLNFLGSDVQSYGMDVGKPGHEKMAGQVSISDYQSPDDFVIELHTQSAHDHLILAKVTPAATLAETVAQVQRRMATTRPIVTEPTDVLGIPKMNFDITRRYNELIGRVVIPATAPYLSDSVITAADQSVRFLMDEKGVQLQSEAGMSISCAAEAPIEPTHHMIFDKPFLLMLSRDDGKSPYFAMWIGNAELLEKWK